MARLIKAVEAAQIISERFDIPLGDLVDVFADIPGVDDDICVQTATKVFDDINRAVVHRIFNDCDYTLVKFAEDIDTLRRKYLERNDKYACVEKERRGRHG